MKIVNLRELLLQPICLLIFVGIVSESSFMIPERFRGFVQSVQEGPIGAILVYKDFMRKCVNTVSKLLACAGALHQHYEK